MAGDLIVLTFQGSDRAAAALKAVQRLAAHGWIELDDAVVALRSAGASDILVMPLTALAAHPQWQPGAEAHLLADQAEPPLGKRFRAPADALAELTGWLLSDPTQQQLLRAPLAAIVAALQTLSEAETVAQPEQIKADVSALFLFGYTEHRALVLYSLRELDSQVMLISLTTEQEQALRVGLKAAIGTPLMQRVEGADR